MASRVLESELPPELTENGSITIRGLPTPPRFLQAGGPVSFLAFGPLKVLYQVASLLWVLGNRLPHARWLLVQVRLRYSIYCPISEP